MFMIQEVSSEWLRKHSRDLLVQGEGLDLAARYLNSLPGASELRVGVQMERAFQKYFDGQVVEFADPSADCLVFAQNTVTRRSGIEAWQALWDAYQFTGPEHRVSFGDNPYVWVYRTDRVPKCWGCWQPRGSETGWYS